MTTVVFTLVGDLVASRRSASRSDTQRALVDALVRTRAWHERIPRGDL